MKASIFSICAITLIPPAFGAGIGSPLTPTAGGVPSSSYQLPVVTPELQLIPQLHATSPRVWRRKESFIKAAVNAAASAAVILAVAFLVLQCFKAIRNTSLGSYSSRRLAYGGVGHNGDNCGVSNSGLCLVLVQLLNGMRRLALEGPSLQSRPSEQSYEARNTGCRIFCQRAAFNACLSELRRADTHTEMDVTSRAPRMEVALCFVSRDAPQVLDLPPAVRQVLSIAREAGGVANSVNVARGVPAFFTPRVWKSGGI
ncbi:hypothetical protein Emed_004742 [Eimeria media]